MNKLLPLGGVLLTLCCLSGPAAAETRWVVDAYPASFIIHTDAADYEVMSGTRSDQMGTVSTFPNIGTGVGLETAEFRLDLLGGAGVMINGKFSSFATYLSGALMYEAARSARIGPRLGLLYFLGPEWNAEADVEYDNAGGAMLGLNVEMGDKISYLVAVDLWWLTFEDSGDPAMAAYEATEDELDLSGIALQFGIRGRF